MNKDRKITGFGCLLLLVAALILAGCEDRAAAPISQNSNVVHDPVPDVAIIDEAEEVPLPSESPLSSPAAKPSGGQQAAQVSSNIDHKDAKAAAETPKQSSKPKVLEKDAYQQQKPTLMGLQIGTYKNTVLDRFGEAANKFVMDEDADAITVYEYVDFSVGFNKANELAFVDVHTDDIDPGLGGLRLGYKSEDAVRILGKPDSNTTYVLSYKAQGTVLRLDIDPKDDTIQSIKLFSNK